MSRILAGLGTMGLVIAATGAMAQGEATTVDMTLYDTDGDGLVSFVELQAVLPELTEEAFTAADASGDGLLDQEELDTAAADGLFLTES